MKDITEKDKEVILDNQIEYFMGMFGKECDSPLITNFLLYKILCHLKGDLSEWDKEVWYDKAFQKEDEKEKNLKVLDKKVIKLGAERGFITSEEARIFYGSYLKRKMRRLVALGYFSMPKDCITYVKWEYKGK